MAAGLGSALETISSGRDAEALRQAIEEQREINADALRLALLARYAKLAADGVRKDPGTYLRSALLTGLHGVARQDDLPLVESATYVYERMPKSPIDIAGLLRAAALLVMAELDERLALYHAVRLLADPDNSGMSGQPALTAVQLLRANDELLPLYLFLTGGGGAAGEVTGECLAAMAGAPDRVVAGLVTRFVDHPDDAVRAGVYDMLLARPEDPTAVMRIGDFIRSGPPDPVYAYVTTTIVAGRVAEMVKVMRETQARISGLQRRMLDEALALLPDGWTAP